MKGRGPRRRVERIELEIDGQVYRGERLVTGAHELHQEVRFEGLREQDPNDYDRDDEPFMHDMARVMLRDLVERSRAKGGRRQPVKVEPRAKPRRRRREK